MTSSVRIGSPAEMVAVVPHLLGFTPHESLVVVCFGGDPLRLIVTARIDLEAGLSGGPSLLPVLMRRDVAAAVVMAFESTPGSGRDTIEGMHEVAALAAVTVLNTVTVCGDSWSAGDRAGTLTGTTAAAVEWVGLGSAPLSSRDALAQLVAPGVDCLTQAQFDAVRWPVACRSALWSKVLRPDPISGAVSDEIAAAAALSLRDTDWRDALLTWLLPPNRWFTLDHLAPQLVAEVRNGVPSPWRTGGDDDRRAGCAITQDQVMGLCRRLPVQEAAPVLTVLATLAWAAGNGALANLAIERALTSEPDYQLAHLIGCAAVGPARFT